MKVCNIPGCPELFTGPGGRCPQHRREARAARTDNAVYSTRAHRSFRAEVLARDPVCVLCRAAIATVADHYPLSRRELETAGLNPNDPTAGRGLCRPCHNTVTANTPGQEGGFRLT